LYSTPRGLAEIFSTSSTSRSIGRMTSRCTSLEKKYTPLCLFIIFIFFIFFFLGITFFRFYKNTM
jgi:hypothetical protein